MIAMRERTTDVHVLAPDERRPRAPVGYLAHQVGLTAHLRRTDTLDRMVCGCLPGTTRPTGRPLGWCVSCWTIAR
jgi:hypothetical protein